mgnify:CR=1 FL=1
MELEGTVRDWIVDIIAKIVSRHHVVDFVVRHGARAQFVKAREDCQHQDDDNQQFFNRQRLPPGENRLVQPAIVVGCVFGREIGKIHSALRV